MKRFYCSVCKKIKHVRRMPKSVVNPRAPKPTDRVGQCSWHVADGTGYYTRNTLDKKVSA